MKRNSREWKEKRAEFLKGKTCAWCGSSDSLCIQIPRDFSPAQISSEIYNAAYTRFKEIYKQEYQKFDLVATGKHRHKSHPSWHKASTVHKIEPDHSELEVQYIEVLLEDSGAGNFKQLYNDWLEAAGIKDLIDEETEKAEKESESLTNAIALCKRCHFASLKGLELCPVCRSKYKPSRFDTCFDCLPEGKKGELLARRQKEERFS